MGTYPAKPFNRHEQVQVLCAPNYDFVTGTLATDNSYCTMFKSYGPSKAMFAVGGTWSGTLYLQWTPYYGSTSPATWFDVESYTSNTVQVVEIATTSGLRLGFKGTHTSGTATYWLGQGM